MRRSINVTDSNVGNAPFSVSTKLDKEGKKTVFTVNPRSVIYKSFNLKDIMVDSSFIDEKTAELIKAKEKDLKRHVITDLSKEQEAYKDSIIYLSLHISPNLNTTYAEVLAGPMRIGEFTADDEPPWEGFPEMIGYTPPLEFNEDGQLKNSFVSRYQSRAYVPIAYITSDPSVIGTSVTFPAEGSKPPETQTLVQILNTNLIIQTFNYDGIPVAYPIPFFGGTYLYYDFLKNKTKK
jgi:hypothetical protein